MSDGVLGLIGVGISVIGTIGIAIYNQRNVRKQNAKMKRLKISFENNKKSLNLKC